MPEVVWVTPGQILGAVAIQIVLVLLAVGATLWVLWPHLANRAADVEQADADVTVEIPVGVVL